MTKQAHTKAVTSKYAPAFWNLRGDKRHNMQMLYDMLSYRRPNESDTEREFIARFLLPLDVKMDSYGNVYRDIGRSPRVLWSSHVDTVHRQEGRQALAMSDDGFIWTEDADSNCLGADCTTGVWIMAHMIQAGIPGRYVFHRGEESGCLGSRFVVQHNRGLLAGIEAAIAFDRMGYVSVITHQLSQRGCSEEFATSLSRALGMGYAPDSSGVYTDTASYMDIVPECTNVSVGYWSQHSKDECQNLNFASDLLDTMLTFSEAKQNSLIIAREPTEYGANDFGFNERYDHASTVADFNMRYHDVLNAVIDHPEAAASLLNAMGYDAYDIVAQLTNPDYSYGSR